MTFVISKVKLDMILKVVVTGKCMNYLQRIKDSVNIL